MMAIVVFLLPYMEGHCAILFLNAHSTQFLWDKPSRVACINSRATDASHCGVSAFHNCRQDAIQINPAVI